MSTEDIIDGLAIIQQKRGRIVERGDVEMLALAIKELRKGRAGEVPTGQYVPPAWKYGDPERRKDNWTLITAEETKRIGKRFKDHRGREFSFFGIVDGYDDYYYGMWSKEHGMVLSSCVGSIQTNGYEEIPSKSLYDHEREQHEEIERERGISGPTSKPECICPKCGLRHGGAVLGDLGF